MLAGRRSQAHSVRVLRRERIIIYLLHLRLVRVSCSRVHRFLRLLVENGLRDVVKEFVDVCTFQGRSLVIGQVELAGQSLALVRRNTPVGQINFVANQNFHYVFARVRIDLLQPIRDIVESQLLRAIVDE